MIDIINAYSSAGYDCVLITGRLVVRNIPLNQAVKVDRIIKYNRTTTFKRLFTWVIGFFQIWVKVAFKYKKDCLFIASNPPLAPLLPLVVKNPFNLLIFDIYPDALSELGYLSDNSRILKWWRKSNRKAFTKVLNIFTITDSMRQVLQQYSGNKVVEVVSLWTDNSFLRPVDPAENAFLKKHGLSGKFIVLYSGNIGLSGDVDVLIDVATKIKRQDIAFLIIGEGAKKIKISEKVDKLKLDNVVLLPWQPVTELPLSLSSASLAVVSLGAKTSKLAVPSKLYNYLSVGAPLLCVSSKGSEVESLVSKYDCGRNFEPDDITGITNFIVEIADNNELKKLMQANSLKASMNFSASNINDFLAATSNDQRRFECQ